MTEANDQPVRMGVDEALQLAREFIARRRFADAEGILHQILDFAPGYPLALMVLAQILEFTGRFEEAVNTYEMWIQVQPGHGIPFTRRAILLLRRHWGPPPTPRKGSGAGSGITRITCNTIGMNGRFGNQLLQYAATRLYAAKNQLVAEFPDWIGRDLFDLDDPLVSEQLPTISEENVDILGALSGRAPYALAGHNLWGYFGSNTVHYAESQAEFLKLFKPGRRLAPAIGEWSKTLQSDRRTVVGLHLRRGDFGGDQFWIAPAHWYLEWLAGIWGSLNRPLLYIATDDRAVLEVFKSYQPITSDELGRVVPGAEFFGDFYALTQADHLAISNSTFSFVAAMLNERAASFLRPEKPTLPLIAFDPWNAPVRFP